MKTAKNTFHRYAWLSGWIWAWCASSAIADCIGVVTAGAGVHYWQQVEQGAKQAALDLGRTVYVRGPKNEHDHKAQSRILDTMLDKGCIGFVVAPNSPQRETQVKHFQSLGIPVVYIDRDIKGSRIGIIATDNYAAGALAAELMAETLDDPGSVGILRLQRGVPSTDLREQGFIARAKDLGLNLIMDEYLGTDQHEATDKAYALLQMHSKLDAVFTPNESTSLAVLNMRKRLPTGASMLHIGFDNHPHLLQAVEQGMMQGLIVQNPFQIGYQGVVTLDKALRQQPFDEQVTVPTTVFVKH